MDKRNLNWRASLAAAGASYKEGDLASARQYATNALQIYSQLKAEWGEEHFATYSSRPDIKTYLEQASDLARSETV